jgi:transposase
MKTGYFWPIYGEDHEVVFTFNKSRGRLHVEDVLRKNFKGTLITDGYSAYARFAEKSQGVTHAQCSATAPALLYSRQFLTRLNSLTSC